MKRFVIQAEPSLLERARRRASERGVSIAQLVRDALAREVGEPRQPKPRSFGRFRSASGNVSRRASADVYRPPPWRS